MRSIRVVAAVIEEEGRFLITQRRPEAVLPMLWEFPGGRVEPGESDEDALRRELVERLDVGIEVGEVFSTQDHDYEGYSVTLVIYRATLSSHELRCDHVNDCRWVVSADLDTYDFPPADQATMDKLLGLSPPSKSN